jgi:hypothetical protein
VGGLVASFGGIFFYSRGRWLKRFNYWHAVKPAIGGITGSVSCVLLVVILRAGTGNGKITTDPATFDASAFVFGYAESAFRQLVKTVTDVFLKPGGGTNTAEKVEPRGDRGEGAATPSSQTARAANGGNVPRIRPRLNVVLAPDSAAHRSFGPPTPIPTSAPRTPNLAPGFTAQPSWNLTAEGGKTISSLTFVNCYVGPAREWNAADRANIDAGLQSALTDAGLQAVMAQYYPGPITSTMLASNVLDVALPAKVYKDTVEALAQQLHAEGVLQTADPASSVIDIMLPKGIVLSSEPSPAAHAAGAHGAGPPSAIERAPPRDAGVPPIGPESAVESTEGLGGYHGSVRLADGTEIYYAVGVYSEGGNGIVAFEEPWKNVVATFYHELNEARTDPDVEAVNAPGNDRLLGWYSHVGQGEIGDLPINACGGDLGLVFKEVPLANGAGSVPIQLMWSNAAGGPAVRN